jgi:hypothetical protein
MELSPRVRPAESELHRAVRLIPRSHVLHLGPVTTKLCNLAIRVPHPDLAPAGANSETSPAACSCGPRSTIPLKRRVLIEMAETHSIAVTGPWCNMLRVTLCRGVDQSGMGGRFLRRGVLP